MSNPFPNRQSLNREHRRSVLFFRLEKLTNCLCFALLLKVFFTSKKALNDFRYRLFPPATLCLSYNISLFNSNRAKGTTRYKSTTGTKKRRVIPTHIHKKRCSMGFTVCTTIYSHVHILLYLYYANNTTAQKFLLLYVVAHPEPSTPVICTKIRKVVRKKKNAFS